MKKQYRCISAGFILTTLTLGAQQHVIAADLKRGELLFQTCAACHSVLGNGVAPDLTGIYGRKVAMHADFNYSTALRNSGIVWNESNLRAFIKNPQVLVAGTTMLFPGYSMQADIDDVIAYLKKLK